MYYKYFTIELFPEVFMKRPLFFEQENIMQRNFLKARP